jgi:hypothetical protein
MQALFLKGGLEIAAVAVLGPLIKKILTIAPSE